MEDQPGTAGWTLREWCLTNIKHDLQEGLRSPAECELLNVLVNYFSKFTFSSMSDMYGLQVIAQQWVEREGYKDYWRRIWPCCAQCAKTQWATGQVLVPLDKVEPCAACGREAADGCYILRSVSDVATSPASQNRQWDRRIPSYAPRPASQADQ
jgi:hypothetical protein